MKQIALSIEQMNHLKELGLNVDDGSIFWEYKGYDYSFTYHNLEILDFDKQLLEPKDVITYTLQDILEILPYKIHYECNGFVCDYTRVITDKCICYDEVEMYPDSEPLKGFYYASKEENSYNSGSMINAFYDMLCWCIENGYIKTVDYDNSK